jgi:CheY-like chemotaxis protein
VHVWSEGLGRGSQFSIALPLERAPLVVRTAEQGNAADTGLRVLIVDDNADAAESLGILLRAIGYKVAVEFNAGAALAYASAQQVQAFVLDIGLPDMSGYELATRLRKIPGCDNAILIALTGYGQEHDRAQAREAGFDHHLTKPADTQQLVAALSGKHRGSPTALMRPAPG